MTDPTNMVCPNCHVYQPLAPVCGECGIAVEKAANSNMSPAAVRALAMSEEKPKTNKLWVLLLLTCIILYLSRQNDEENAVAAVPQAVVEQPATPEQEPLDVQEPLDEPATVDSDVAMGMRQYDRVVAKLEALESVLYRLGAEGKAPPGNEEGLRLLVDRGLLTESGITDEWGNPFVYRIEWGEQPGSDRGYRVFVHSAGPDGISGNIDDVFMP